jgi:PPOX class probable F420-dependent enzyme
MTVEHIAAVPEKFVDILNSTALALIATLGPKGEPQTSPVWFDWDGQVLRFSHTKARQKYRNLRRDPRISVCIVHPQNPYRYVELRGIASIEDDPASTLIHKLAKKYTGSEKYEGDAPGTERVIITVTPTAVKTMG